MYEHGTNMFPVGINEVISKLGLPTRMVAEKRKRTKGLKSPFTRANFDGHFLFMVYINE